MTYLNTALGSLGVSLSRAAPGTLADVHIHFATTTPEGRASDGVVGFTTADNNVYFVVGWNFYTAADASAIGANQYDLLTLSTHELAHTVGLGESMDPRSVLYEYLAPGTVRRTFTDSNLALINTNADRFMKVSRDLLDAGWAGVQRASFGSVKDGQAATVPWSARNDSDLGSRVGDRLFSGNTDGNLPFGSVDLWRSAMVHGGLPGRSLEEITAAAMVRVLD
jgi:hypothetical protein